MRSFRTARAINQPEERGISNEKAKLLCGRIYPVLVIGVDAIESVYKAWRAR